MQFWGFYFLVKLYLYSTGGLKLDIPWNLAFCIFLLLPLPKRIGRFRYLKVSADVIFGVLLFWHDSWFPPILQTVAFVRQQGLPSTDYILEFIGRYLTREVVVYGGIAYIACHIMNNHVKLVPIAMVAILLTIPIHRATHKKMDAAEIDATSESFFDYESSRAVHFKKPKSGEPDFDIAIIHVCSLAWDDLDLVGMDRDKFFGQFHILFANFNGVTSYSGPAALRVLRAPCGQLKHEDLYKKGESECYSLDALKSIGYEPYVALNHDGKYGAFSDDIKTYGRIDKPFMPIEGLAPEMHMFDESPVYENYAVLQRWWNTRLKKTDGPPAVLYYNTVSLHDGSHWVYDREWFKRDLKVMYKEFLTKIFADVAKFMGDLAASGRNVVVVFIPEHGVALRGSAIQQHGLRDIPLPQITELPVGIKFIGPKFNGAPMRQTIERKPASYLAIAHMLSFYVEHSPFSGTGTPNAALSEMPVTEYVAENEGARIIQVEGRYFLYGKEKKWVELDQDQIK